MRGIWMLNTLLNGQTDLVKYLTENHLELAEEQTLVTLWKSKQLENGEEG